MFESIEPHYGSLCLLRTQRNHRVNLVCKPSVKRATVIQMKAQSPDLLGILRPLLRI